jgi:DNA polymerase elongation subunit (family B)
MNLYRAFESDPLLIDMNYLSELFRRQLSEAVERILNAFDEETLDTSELAMTVGAGKSLG